jgi:hypothetical protein
MQDMILKEDVDFWMDKMIRSMYTRHSRVNCCLRGSREARLTENAMTTPKGCMGRSILMGIRAGKCSDAMPDGSKFNASLAYIMLVMRLVWVSNT